MEKLQYLYKEEIHKISSHKAFVPVLRAIIGRLLLKKTEDLTRSALYRFEPSDQRNLHGYITAPYIWIELILRYGDFRYKTKLDVVLTFLSLNDYNHFLRMYRDEFTFEVTVVWQGSIADLSKATQL
jgi:hypothetical protein